LAIKPELVRDVVVRLRSLALREAELLFREFRLLPGYHHGFHTSSSRRAIVLTRVLLGSLPDFSFRISEAINRLTDAIADDLDSKTGGDYDQFMSVPSWARSFGSVRSF
jgi:hypothetical protein